jgi:hypothetical protein
MHMFQENIVSWVVTRDNVLIGKWIYCTLKTRNYNLQFTITYYSTSVAWQQLQTADVPLLPGSRPRKLVTICSNCQPQTDSQLTSKASWSLLYSLMTDHTENTSPWGCFVDVCNVV